LLSFMGLFSLFKIGLAYFKNFYLALITPLLLFISPIFVFYSNNFLVNIPALSFVFMGWLCATKFSIDKKNRYLILGGFSFALAGLLRATMLSGLIPFILLFVLERMSVLKGRYTKWDFHTLWFLLFPVVINLSWIYWMKKYNMENESQYFFTHINPIWRPWGSASEIWDAILNLRLPEFYQLYLLIALILITVFIVVKMHLLTPYLKLLFVTIGAFVIGYFVLFFNQFKQHDYYYIDYYLYVVILILTFIHLLNHYFSSIIKSKPVVIISILLFSFSLAYSAIKSNTRYEVIDNSLSNFFLNEKELDRIAYEHWAFDQTMKNVIDIATILRILDIEREDHLISLPDFSPNISLYLLDQKGYTNMYTQTTEDFTIREKVIAYKNQGAKYLLTYDSLVIKKENLADVLETKIYTSENRTVSIYRLK